MLLPDLVERLYKVAETAIKNRDERFAVHFVGKSLYVKRDGWDVGCYDPDQGGGGFSTSNLEAAERSLDIVQ